ncbi:hypothetical protein AVEN_180811-1 [Araneus ventricosus]|uniref:Uncharacterized protein n=1 Tax=Araneus ventricosus TaxID=182803 RepID=A0A4Y2GYA2_ARAVE|nr:hypothetical protein AVEN_71812-1 [Araneus ventricosus]GBM57775.1 hypothetical protein AVEN_180811-1 [Araneus ventricosus]
MAQESNYNFDKHYTGSESSIRTVNKWFGSIRIHHMSTCVAELLGCPFEVTTQDIIDKVHHVVSDDRRAEIPEIVQAIRILNNHMHNILHGHTHL